MQDNKGDVFLCFVFCLAAVELPQVYTGMGTPMVSLVGRTSGCCYYGIFCRPAAVGHPSVLMH